MINMSIECNVTNCKYNHEVERYCTLSCIKVTKNAKEAANASDCASFEEK